MPLNNPKGYMLMLVSMPAAGFNPADSTTLYIGNQIVFAPTTVDGGAPIWIPHSGTITRVWGQWINNAVSGSAENVSLALRVAAATDYSITSTLQVNTAVNNFNNQAMAVPVTQGQILQVKLVTPAWVTNPTAVTIFIQAWVSVP